MLLKLVTDPHGQRRHSAPQGQGMWSPGLCNPGMHMGGHQQHLSRGVPLGGARSDIATWRQRPRLCSKACTADRCISCTAEGHMHVHMLLHRWSSQVPSLQPAAALCVVAQLTGL